MTRRDLSRLPHELNARKHTCRAVVETPRGSRWKLTFEPKTGAFEASNLLPDGMSFPMDFGFVPATEAEDGDPIDVMVLSEEPLPMGVVVPVRLIGVIEGEQTEKGKTLRNDRLLAVAEPSHLYADVASTDDLAADFLGNLERFWVNYNALKGREFKVVGTRDAKAAVEAVQGAARQAA